MAACVLRKVCYYLRVFLVPEQHAGDCRVPLFKAVCCVLLLVECLVLWKEWEIGMPLVYIVLLLKKKNQKQNQPKINMCLCNDKKVSVTCTQSWTWLLWCTLLIRAYPFSGLSAVLKSSGFCHEDLCNPAFLWQYCNSCFVRKYFLLCHVPAWGRTWGDVIMLDKNFIFI